MASLEDLDDDVILCNVCNNEYDQDQRSPKLLPCLHTLCNDCTLNAVQGSSLTCSLCAEVHRVSGDLHFLNDSTMRNMMDLINLQRKSSSIPCSDCPDNNTGENFCKDCYVFLCTECTSAHKRTQVTRRHVVLSMDELKTSGLGSFSKKEMCLVPGHEDQPFSFYCENEECQKPVCTQCIVNEHSQSSGHVIRNLSDVHEENKHLVERLVGELLGKISSVSSDAKQLEGEVKSLDDTYSDVKGKIDKLFDELEELLKARREKLKQRVDVIVEQRKQELAGELTQLQTKKGAMENSCNYSSRMLVFTNKPEFLQLKSTVINKLEQLLSESHESKFQEPIELSFTTNDEAEAFKNFVAEIGEVVTNIYGESRDKEATNGKALVNGGFKMPYKGPPLNPPGKYMGGKFSTSKASNPNRAKVEPLRLEGLNSEPPTKSTASDYTPPYKSKATPSTTPTDTNVLGRPLSLKAPVFTPTKQPTSLGDFLNGRSFQLIIRCNSTKNKREQQDVKEPERQLPKTPPPTPAINAQKMSPLSPLSPPGGFSGKNVTSSNKYGGPVGSLNGNATTTKTESSYIQKSKIMNGSTTKLSPSEERAKTSGILLKTPSKWTSENNVKADIPRSNKEQSISFATGTKFGNSSPTSLTGKGNPILTEDSYPDVKPAINSPRKTQAGKPVVFGDVSCPDFHLDVNSAHHEREVSADGRTLRNKKTDVYSAGPLDIDNSLVQYKGAIGTQGFQELGKFYFEVDVVYNIHQPLEETWLVFEIGLCRFDDVDMHHTVERHEFARSFYVARFPEDGKLTQEFWHNRDLLSCVPLSDNTSGLEVRITYGFLVDTKRRQWTVADCNNNKVLYNFDSLDFTEALYPVFGCYNPDLCTVEMTLKTGTDITMVPQCLQKQGIRSP